MNKVGIFLKVLIFSFAVLSSFTVKAEQSHIATDVYAIEATLPIEHLALETNLNAVELSSRQYKSVEVSGFKNTDPDSEASTDVILCKSYLFNGFQKTKSDCGLYQSYFSSFLENQVHQRGPPLHIIA